MPGHVSRGPDQFEMESTMAQKLIQGVKIPNLSLNLIDGHSLDLPAGMTGRYLALLLYRGNW